MTETIPSLMSISDFDNNWDVYLEELYRIYLAEIVNSKLTFNGLPIRVQFRPESHGKGFGFWHLISEGRTEDERIPDLRRCERVRWIPWVIRNVGLNKNIKWWKNKRGTDIHVVLWANEEEFVVILAERKGYYLLRSAYPVNSRREKKFWEEWQEYWKKG